VSLDFLVLLHQGKRTGNHLTFWFFWVKPKERTQFGSSQKNEYEYDYELKQEQAI
jgi:hypothetical protein